MEKKCDLVKRSHPIGFTFLALFYVVWLCAAALFIFVVHEVALGVAYVAIVLPFLVSSLVWDLWRSLLERVRVDGDGFVATCFLRRPYALKWTDCGFLAFYPYYGKGVTGFVLFAPSSDSLPIGRRLPFSEHRLRRMGCVSFVLSDKRAVEAVRCAIPSELAPRFENVLLQYDALMASHCAGGTTRS